MRVTIFTQYYPPEIGAPQRRLAHLARAIARRGHDVTVLTAMPSYPLGKIYSGYGGLLREEVADGIHIVRTFIYPSQSARLLPRLANYFTFLFSSFLLGGWKTSRCDYLIVESPPLFLGLAGWLLARWKRARLVFNVSDIWPESALRIGVIKPGPLLALSSRLEGFCYRHAWLVTGQSEGIIGSIHARFPDARCYLLSNGVDTDEFKPRTEEALVESQGVEHCTAAYAGLHGLAQGLDQVVDAACLLREYSGLSIEMMGDGPCKQDLRAQVQAASLSNVRLLDPVPASSVPAWLARADIAIVPLKTYIPGAVPSKLYEAMAVGLPVVLIAEGEPAEIVRRYEAGLAVAPGDIAGLAAALRQLAESKELRRELGANGRRAAEQHYDRNRINDSFAVYLQTQLRN